MNTFLIICVLQGSLHLVGGKHTDTEGIVPSSNEDPLKPITNDHDYKYVMPAINNGISQIPEEKLTTESKKYRTSSTDDSLQTTTIKDNCNAATLNLTVLKAVKNYVQIGWEIPDSWSSTCRISKVDYAVTPDQYNSICNVSEKQCTFKELRKFAHYTFTILPTFQNDQKGEAASVNYFTVGDCILQQFVTIDFDDDGAWWNFNETLAKLMNYSVHFVVAANQIRPHTCGEEKISYSKTNTTDLNGFVKLNNNRAGWEICISPIRIPQSSGPNCKKAKCLSNHIIGSPDHLRVDNFTLTSQEWSLKASWSSNSLMSGCPLNHYKISIFPAPCGSPSEIRNNCTKINCEQVIENLLPNENYIVKILPVFQGDVLGTEEHNSASPVLNTSLNLNARNVGKNVEVFLTIPKSWENGCQFSRIHSLVNSNQGTGIGIGKGICNVKERKCTYEDLEEFKNYTFTIQLSFGDTLIGQPSYLEFFNVGKCIPTDSLRIEFTDTTIEWEMNKGLMSYHFLLEVLVYINQQFSCGGEEFLYRKYQTDNDSGSISLNNNFSGTWKVCMIPVKTVGYPRSENCLNEVCHSKNITRISRKWGKEFELTPGRKSLRARWSPKAFIKSNCSLDHYDITIHSARFELSETIQHTCTEVKCEKVIDDLMPEVKYSVTILPVFKGNYFDEWTGWKKFAFPLTSCPKVENVTFLRNESAFYFNWTDVDKMMGDYVEFTRFIKEPCENEFKEKRDVNVSRESFVSEELPPYLDVKISILPRTRAYFGCQEESIEMIYHAQSISLDAKTLTLKNLTERSAEVSWMPDDIWHSVCHPNVSEGLCHNDTPVLNSKLHCSNNSCVLPNLSPFTLYTLKVRACSNRYCEVSELNFTTLDLHPFVSQNLLSVDYDDFDTFVTYGDANISNANCTITAKKVHSQAYLYFELDCKKNCTIYNSDEKLEFYSTYEVKFRVCNSRGCNSSNELTVSTPPNPACLDRKNFTVNINVTASNSTLVTLDFPKLNGSCNGTIYLVVADEDFDLDAEKCETLVKHRKETEKQKRFKRSAENLLMTKFVLVEETVALGSAKYNLQIDYLSKQNMDLSKRKKVAAVVDDYSGSYSKVSGYEFSEPFQLPCWDLSAAWKWPISIFLIIVFLAFLIIILLKRNRNTLSKFANFVISYRHYTTRASSTSPTYESSQNNTNLDIESEKLVMDFQNPKAENQCSSALSEREVLEYTEVEAEIYGNINHKVYLEELEYYLIQNAYSQKLEEEYKDIPILIPGKSTMVSKNATNHNKNRYRNNPAYDDTRVVLPLIPGNPSSDYINASFIDIVVDESGAMARYISTQGPMINRFDTVADFWRMIWHEKVEAIIMVTNLIENGKIKCAQYWPDLDTSLQAYDIEITPDEPDENKESFIIRRFNITSQGQTRKVTQYHFVEWPDHGVPLEAAPLAQMIKIVRANHRYGPTTIHCSAGIGRTGTLLLVILCLEELALLKYVNVKEGLKRLRKCRPKMIQNFGQYQFAHYLLWVILFEHKTTFLNDEYVRTWTSSVQPCNLRDQFKKLKTFNKELTYRMAKSSSCKKLNRYANILPADSRLVTLTGNTGSKSEQYINAVVIDGFNRKDAYIVAEYPLAHTVYRVWLMVLERQIPLCVLLNEFPQADADFLPLVPDVNEKCLSLGIVTVELIETTDYEHFKESLIRIYSHSEDYPGVIFETRVIQFHGWEAENDLPPTGSDTLHLLLDYIESIGPFSNPVLYSCLDGVTACGLALALDITRSRAKSFQDVSIFSSCITITYNRPEFITSLEQYRYLHDAMATYFLMQNEETYCDVDEIF